MSTPVTRGELREELEQLEGRFDHKLERLEQRLDERFDHKLEIWGGALLARMESSECRMTEMLSKAIESSEQRLSAELARHTRAIEESLATRIAVVDEKYADLPGRVQRLEAHAFGGEPRVRSSRRRPGRTR